MKKNNLDIMQFLETCNNYNSEVINQIAVEFSKVDIDLIKDNLLQNFLKHNENMNVLIIKIFIFNSSKGLEILLNYFEDKKIQKLRTRYYNVIGKYVSLNISKHWKVITDFIDTDSENIKYILTRIFYYLGDADKNLLKKYVVFDELVNIYQNDRLLEKYRIKKLKDSSYYSNYEEIKYSMEKALRKIASTNLINNNYNEKHYNEIFTEDGYIEELLDRIEKEKDIKKEKREEEYCILTSYGNELLGKELLSIKSNFKSLSYKKTIKDYYEWLDLYSEKIYTIIIEYGESNFEKMFYLDNALYGGWASEILFRCRITNKSTMKKAKQIISKLLENNYKKELSIVEKGVLSNLIEYVDADAIKIYKNRNDKDLLTKNQNEHFAFSIQKGICEKYYGTIEMARHAYKMKMQNKGHYWEKVVGYVLPKIFQCDRIVYHPIFSNDTIPDYVIEYDNTNIVIECKLTLGFKELRETLKKYSSYTKRIYFFCYRISFSKEDYDSKEFDDIVSKYDLEIKFYEYQNLIDYIPENHAEILKKEVEQTSQVSLLSNRILEDSNYSLEEKNNIINMLNKSWGKSSLFS